jgi:hypothetical protein
MRERHMHTPPDLMLADNKSKAFVPSVTVRECPEFVGDAYWDIAQESGKVIPYGQVLLGQRHFLSRKIRIYSST